MSYIQLLRIFIREIGTPIGDENGKEVSDAVTAYIIREIGTPIGDEN